MSKIKFTKHDDGMAFITLNKPPVNVLSRAVVKELHDIIKKLDDSTRVLIISSAAKHFCAGLDLREQLSLNPDDAAKSVQEINACFNALQELPFPSIAAIHGSALGGGAELSLACDFRLMEDSAMIGLPETSIGTIPGAGGTQRLARLIGPARAKFWIFTAERFPAEIAMVEGVADFLCEEGELMETAMDIAQDLMACSPLGIRAAKIAIDKGLELPIAEGLKIEQSQFEFTIKTKDRREGIAAFNEKRDPKWKGE